MKQLLEDYKRRLATANKMIEEYNLDNGTDGYGRLLVKASCYRTFISELEKAIKEQTQ